MNSEVTIYLGLGSNIGNKIENIIVAVDKLKSNSEITFVALSSFYETEPREYLNQDNFINAVVKLQTTFSAIELYKIIKNIETEMGRKTTFQNGPRLIDIDILLYGDEIINTNGILIPHTKIGERKFVLIPFAEIDNSVIIPGIQKSISQLLDSCNDSGVVQIIVEKNILV
ncbi:MAG: 2-amino-4-hydroxy-6-hydroxymethyldihydropteridine diphosphokinase [Ignavibacteria bacterium]|nr:2-amino-4-hydroxy-6-hydroxymethyldihydropteridine diphosphokinase [Bacteroidota bacterium]MSQ46046.1 2-amino-4-hydroxy-6-hydroxymethyldihydropteridine diphosphokinase [Ignavibacteria bacterium]